MSGYFEGLKFKYPWRPYQKRVLDELDSHLDDDRLHVVAAPGSGKTILGLEVMRRLNQPSLILAPSIAIRNQWVERLLNMFMDEEGEKTPDWISTDIRNPKHLTVSTYQGLHSVFSGEAEELEDAVDEEEIDAAAKSSEKKAEVFDVVSELNKLKVRCVVLDEAHHLRKAWWKSLNALTAGLNDATLVSLTATPPYDVSYAEWKRYEDLCGSVDAEISIPELVKCQNLCPHQDYVYFSVPTENEAEKLDNFNSGLSKFLKALKQDQEFIKMIGSHPWVKDTENHVEEILDEAELFSAIIIYLNACGFAPPPYALGILGVREEYIPHLNSKWLEVVLSNFLYRFADNFPDYQDKIKALRKDLKRLGAIDRRKVVLDNTKEIQKLLASSLGKLESIVDITRQESAGLGEGLRMVVLADYIRKAELPKNKDDMQPINKIGVVPIFEYLRRARIDNIKLGVLTGSLIFIPRQAQEQLETIADNEGVDKGHIRFVPVPHDDDYLRVEIKGESRQKIVHLVTELFNAGGITVLIGTAALLGEGWDAPSINTLILASYVGSYMLSNQMRGRAIRINPDAPDKVANIWHLVAVDIKTVEDKVREFFSGQETYYHVDPFDEIKENLGHDLNKLRRRFRAFEGLSYDAPIQIENGFKRLHLSGVKWNASGVRQLNNTMLEKAQARHMLAELWQEALQGKCPKPQVREKIESNTAAVPTMITYMYTLKYMVMNALIGGAYYILSALENAASLQAVLVVALGVLLFYTGPKLVKAAYLLFRNGSLEKSMKQVAWAVLDTLAYMGIVKTNSDHIRIEAVQERSGLVYCRIDGVTKQERQYFMQAMQDILSPIDNPRYLIVRRSKFLRRIARTDYHPVPQVIGQKKKYAEYFAKKWRRYVGESELFYTRNVEGRVMLLQARTQSFSAAFQKKAERISVWE